MENVIILELTSKILNAFSNKASFNNEKNQIMTCQTKAKDKAKSVAKERIQRFKDCLQICAKHKSQSNLRLKDASKLHIEETQHLSKKNRVRDLGRKNNFFSFISRFKRDMNKMKEGNKKLVLISPLERRLKEMKALRDEIKEIKQFMEKNKQKTKGFVPTLRKQEGFASVPNLLVFMGAVMTLIEFAIIAMFVLKY